MVTGKKSVFTRDEKKIYDRFDGKPVKPPSSGYAMFSQQRLQLGQKMEFMGQRWRELTYNYQNEFKQEAEKAKLNTEKIWRGIKSFLFRKRTGSVCKPIWHHEV